MNTLQVTVPHKFRCRPYQDAAWRAIRNGVKRLVCCWHRGCGKDLMFLNSLIELMTEKPGVYLHCFPNYSQGKRAIWNSVHQTDEGESMAYLDHFPDVLIESKNSSEMMIKLKTGSIYCVMGVDGKNAQRARGMNPTGIILSEYAFMDPMSWQTIEPRITQNNGIAVFLSTPNGQNHFYQLYNYAKTKPEDYFTSFLTIEDTHTVSKEHIENLRREGVPEDFIQQEYYCSFTRGAEGSYYGKQIQKCRDEGRITDLNVNSCLPCYTAWDIGIGDSTAIWIFQALENGKYNFLHYYENHGENIEHYCRYLDNWKRKNDISWGRHFVPHDMKNEEFIAGITRVEAARKLGYDVDVLEKLPIDEGINAVRSLFPSFVFDQNECRQGIKCLDFYRKKYNDILKVYYDTPCHDQWSHGADSMRYACMGIKSFGTSINSMSPEKLQQIKNRAGYGPKAGPRLGPQTPFIGR
jgi:phage terminase large subunit